MGQEPDAIREDIEETRARMTEKADALAYKSDVPVRSKDKLHEMTDKVKDKVSGVLPSGGGQKDAAADKAGHARDAAADKAGRARDVAADRVSHAKDSAAGSARKAKGLASSNPLGLAVGALAAGFLAGLAVPSTRVEDEKLGPLADDIKAKVSDLGEEAVERGKEVAGAAGAAAKDAAADSAQEQKSGLQDSAKQQTTDVRENAPL